jgi:hypothetical protein
MVVTPEDIKTCRARLKKELCDNEPWEIREIKRSSKDRSANISWKNFEGGSFSYHWPKESDTCICLTADLSAWTFTWTITTSHTSIYHPGPFTGTLSIPKTYPFKSPTIFFSNSPECPYVGRNGELFPENGWANDFPPTAELHNILTGLAAFKHYGPDLKLSGKKLLNEGVKIRFMVKFPHLLRGDLTAGQQPATQIRQDDLMVGQQPAPQLLQDDLMVGQQPAPQLLQGDVMVGQQPDPGWRPRWLRKLLGLSVESASHRPGEEIGRAG